MAAAPGVGARLRARFTGRALATSIRNMAIAGAVLGLLAGVIVALTRHLAGGAFVTAMLRLCLAGAAAGAGIPSAIKAALSAARAIGWFVLALLLWWLALYAAGQTGWLAKLH